MLAVCGVFIAVVFARTLFILSTCVEGSDRRSRYVEKGASLRRVVCVCGLELKQLSFLLFKVCICAVVTLDVR